MSAVDERVVSMEFDNKEFQTGVKDTLTSLDALNKGLKLEGATKGLEDVQTAASRFSLAGIASGVQNIASKFQTMSVIAIAAISNIVTKAVTAGLNIAKALTIDPIKAGFENYETQIKAIQTILANTQADGTKLADVTKVLAELNDYANKTVYNFSEMTANIGTFTAAGVKLQPAADAIKGIANLAALSGSSSEQAATAMYQLSQAIAAGKVGLQDWNSVVNAGLGGKTLQTALINTARASGVAIDSIIKKSGSFRNSLQEGWLTSNILTKTLSQFTGDLSEAQIKAMGFTDAEAKSILKLGQTAVDSATKIKTMSQLTDALKEEVATAYAAIFKTIFGGIGEATDTFSKVHTVVENALTGPIYALNKVLQGVDKLGGRAKVIDAITNVFKGLGAILKPVGQAFREIFPPATAKQIFDVISAIDDFTKKLKIGASTADEIKRTFAGLFAVLDIGKTVLLDAVKVFVHLFSSATQGSGGILKSTASFGDFLVALDKAIQSGKGLTRFFGELEADLEKPIELIRKLDTYVSSLFKNVGTFDPDKAAKDVTKVASALDPLALLGKTITTVWSKAVDVIEKVWETAEPIAEKMGAFFSKVGESVQGAFEGINWDRVLSLVNTGLFAGMLLLIKKFIASFKGSANEIKGGGGIFDAVKEALEGVTGTLKTMQNTLKAATLLEIAAALGILTISVVALSKINSSGLERALSAMSVMFVQLGAALLTLDKTMSDSKLLKLYLITGALSALAIAIDLLTVSVVVLSKLSWDQLEKGLAGVMGLLAALVVTVQLMPNDAKLFTTAAGLTLLAVAIHLLAGSVIELDGLSWTEMAKGLSGVAGLLISLALFTKFADAEGTGVLAGAGIVLLATGIRLLVSAVQDFSKMSWPAIAKGLAALAGVLVAIDGTLDSMSPTAPLAAAGVLITAVSLGMVADALAQMAKMSWGGIGKSLTIVTVVLSLIDAALDSISPTAPLSAAGVLIIAIALLEIAKVLDQFAKMSWGQIAKAIVVLTASLFLIADALDLMVEALPGAAALLIVSASLAILAPILLLFASMSWGDIVKGLTALAGVFLVIGVAGLVLAPVAVVLLALGVAITLLGIGVALTGAGIFLFAAGLTALSIAGAAGAIALTAIVTTLLGLLPLVGKEIGLALIAFAQTIGAAGPAIVEAITVVLLSLITAIDKLVPAIVKTLVKLIVLLIQTLQAAIPSLVNSGLKMLTGILSGIANNIGKVVTTATSIIVNFLNGITKNTPRVLQAGADLIIGFVQSLADAINNNTARMNKAGANLAEAIINGMTGGLLHGVSKVTGAAKNVAESALKSAKDFLGINSPSKEFHKIGMGTDEGFANGINDYGHLVTKATEGVGSDAMASLTKAVSGVADLVSGNIDVTPTITPVLDLSQVQKSAGQLGSMFATKPISLNATAASANIASVGFEATQGKFGPDYGNDPQAPVTFNQFNNSPKALSASEIYRQTHNQLSVAAKGVQPNAHTS